MIETVILAEYPEYKDLMLRLKGLQNIVNLDELCNAWDTNIGQVRRHVNNLVEIGFLMPRDVKKGCAAEARKEFAMN